MGNKAQNIQNKEVDTGVNDANSGKFGDTVGRKVFYLGHATIISGNRVMNKKTTIERSIIIPAYAEEQFIAATLRQVHEYLAAKNWLESTEVIVVTADAQDKTQAIVAGAIMNFPHGVHINPGPRVGKGRDVKAGMAAAHGQYVVFTDADLATPVEHFTRMFELLTQKGGMVIGVRNLKSMHKTWYRRLSSVVSNLPIRFVVGWDVRDSQCGFKGFDRKTTDLLLGRSQIMGWGFDFEFIKIAKTNRLPLSMIRITDWFDPKGADAGLAGDSQLKAMYRTLKELWRVMKLSANGVYKAK